MRNIYARRVLHFYIELGFCCTHTCILARVTGPVDVPTALRAAAQSGGFGAFCGCPGVLHVFVHNKCVLDNIFGLCFHIWVTGDFETVQVGFAHVRTCFGALSRP